LVRVAFNDHRNLEFIVDFKSPVWAVGEKNRKGSTAP
jgi:hypothetical protein